MHAFVLSFRSEFYKTRKTLTFLSAILLPLILCGFLFTGFYLYSDKLTPYSPLEQWARYMGAILGVMGALILPMLVIFQTYSINSIEHRSDMWKSVFSLPIPKWSIYSSKFVYAVFLDALCLSLFATCILLSAWLMNLLLPELKFNQFDIVGLLFKIHLKLFLASLGIVSIQFILSLLWADFLKPMGIGFVLTVAGVICSNMGWKYAYTIPYSHPSLAMISIFSAKKSSDMQSLYFELMTREIYVSLGVAVVAFIAGYFIISKRSVK
ncbi:ABC transporter permease [Daejeonella oryzae]|uniref:ABC transporter permease n=1 Tax=Daejeonella oryzae TaxID=1122943 RepID=UPI00047A19A7|nr:ABC transporter permease [Daejeonella oryzae]